MTVELIDYAGNKTAHDIGDIYDIYYAYMQILSGDEVLTVVYMDGTQKVFDSCHTRMESTLQNEYAVYMPGKRNMFDNDKWANRMNSYDY